MQRDRMRASIARRDPRLLTVIVLVALTVWLLFSVDRSAPAPVIPIRTQMPQLENIDPDATLSNILFRAEFSDFVPDLTEYIQASISPTAKWGQDDVAASPKDEAVSVRIPFTPSKPDASSLLIGLATTIDRLDDSLSAFSHWAAGTRARFVVVISPSDDQQTSTKSDVLAKAEQMGMLMTIVEVDKDYIGRYVSLIDVFASYIESSTKWCVIIDDDTFFPSMHRLLKMLGKYDTQVPQYVGGLTEDIAAIQMWGYMAFGGAGVFMSVPLVRQLQPYSHKCHEFSVSSGDSRIANCIYQYTTAKLRVEPDLYQLDLFGDYTGFFEAARPLPVSLHHWKSWGHYDLVEHSKISKVTGQDSIFQKYSFADGYWMTHGFSIVKYSDDAGQGSLSRFNGSMERTFDKIKDENENTLLHSLAPFRPKDKGKVQYMMEAAIEEDSNSMSLYYVRRENGVGTGIIRTIWTAG